MAILSFQKQFAAPIKAGTKRQTIRQDRVYPIRPWDHLYLYTGLRTRHAKKIGEAQCISTNRITLTGSSVTIHGMLPVMLTEVKRLNRFAKEDGFSSWKELTDFWYKHHGTDCFPFSGTIIYWNLFQKKNWVKPLKRTTPQERELVDAWRTVIKRKNYDKD